MEVRESPMNLHDMGRFVKGDVRRRNDSFSTSYTQALA
jgi:hypothetical protein